MYYLWRNPYPQALCISIICTETNEMTKHLAELKKTFLKRVYQSYQLYSFSSNASLIVKNILRWKIKKNQFEHLYFWHSIKPYQISQRGELELLKINNKRKHVFDEKRIIAYHQNTKDIIGDKNKKVLTKQTRILKEGYWKPCSSKINNLCCNKSYQPHFIRTNVTFNIYRIFHQLYYKSGHFKYNYLNVQNVKYTMLGNQKPNF